jgi:23S rRNA pseudouridine1911/1915/1917 synthase
LAYKFPEKSREFFNHNIKNGKILLNKIIVKPSIKLQINDEIDIDDKIFEQFKVELLPNKTIKLKIVFENDDFAIIDKPAGLLVHPVKADDNNTLVNALIHK